jgi:hypothetical protein
VGMGRAWNGVVSGGEHFLTSPSSFSPSSPSIMRQLLSVVLEDEYPFTARSEYFVCGLRGGGLCGRF